MGARQAAASWIRLWTVAALPGSEHRFDRARADVDSSDHVVLGICDVQRPVGAQRQPLRPTKLRRKCGPAVARPPLFAGPRNALQRLGGPDDSEDRVALAKGKKH